MLRFRPEQFPQQSHVFLNDTGQNISCSDACLSFKTIGREAFNVLPHGACAVCVCGVCVCVCVLRAPLGLLPPRLSAACPVWPLWLRRLQSAERGNEAAPFVRRGRRGLGKALCKRRKTTWKCPRTRRTSSRNPRPHTCGVVISACEGSKEIKAEKADQVSAFFVELSLRIDNCASNLYALTVSRQEMHKKIAFDLVVAENFNGNVFRKSALSLCGENGAFLCFSFSRISSPESAGSSTYDKQINFCPHFATSQFSLVIWHCNTIFSVFVETGDVRSRKRCQLEGIW